MIEPSCRTLPAPAAVEVHLHAQAGASRPEARIAIPDAAPTLPSGPMAHLAAAREEHARARVLARTARDGRVHLDAPASAVAVPRPRVRRTRRFRPLPVGPIRTPLAPAPCGVDGTALYHQCGPSPEPPWSLTMPSRSRSRRGDGHIAQVDLQHSRAGCEMRRHRGLFAPAVDMALS